jgi:hypothetical protein
MTKAQRAGTSKSVPERKSCHVLQMKQMYLGQALRIRHAKRAARRKR